MNNQKKQVWAESIIVSAYSINKAIVDVHGSKNLLKSMEKNQRKATEISDKVKSLPYFFISRCRIRNKMTYNYIKVSSKMICNR